MKSPIPRTWDVPQIFRERMGEQAGRQRAMVADGHLLLVLHGVPDPRAPDVREGKLFWRAPDGTWRSSDAGGGVGPLRALLESFRAVAESLEERVEKAQRADAWFEVVHAAGPVVRTVHNLHATLQKAREEVPGDRDVLSLRDQAYELERTLDLIHAHAKEGLSFTIARNAEEQARATQHTVEAAHRLNLLASVTFPITALGALLGMNLAHGFEQWNAPYTFWVVSGVSLLLGFALRASLPRPPAAR